MQAGGSIKTFSMDPVTSAGACASTCILTCSKAVKVTATETESEYGE